MKDKIQDKKIEILLAALDERYESLRTIRERIQSIGIWAIGILLAAGGWLIQSGIILSSCQKLIYILGLGAAFIVLRFFYIEDLARGFKNQQRVTARLEESLGMFESKIFDEREDSIYPQSWKNSGTEQGDGKFIYATYALLYTGGAFLLAAIFFNGLFL